MAAAMLLLPEEITLQILSYLALEDLLTVAETSRLLFNLHCDVLLPGTKRLSLSWQCTEGPRRLPPPFPVCLLRRYQGLTHLSLGAGISPETFTYGLLDTICTTLPDLQQLIINVSSLTSVPRPKPLSPSQWKSLRHLELRNTAYGDEIVPNYINHMPHLQHLALFSCPFMTSLPIPPRTASGLRYLGTDIALYDDQLLPIISCSNRLGTLDIINATNLSSQIFPALERCLKSLHHLSFCGAREWMDEVAFTETILSWTSLESLDLSGSEFIRNSSSERLGRAARIRVILPCGFASIKESIVASNAEVSALIWNARRERAEARRAWYELATIGIKDETEAVDEDEGTFARSRWRLPPYIDRPQYTYCDPANVFPPDDSGSETLI